MNDTLDQHASSQHGLVPRPYRTLERYVSRFELPQPMATDTECLTRIDTQKTCGSLMRFGDDAPKKYDLSSLKVLGTVGERCMAIVS